MNHTTLLAAITLALLTSNIASASKITCQTALMQATSNPEDNLGAIKQTKMVFKAEDPQTGLRDTTLNLTSSTGQNVEVYGVLSSRENVSGILEFTTNTKVVGQGNDHNISTVLLKNDGESRGGGWDIGPKGATQYKLLATNSLNEKPIHARITGTAFRVLKKYGLTSAQVDMNTFELYQKVAEAVKKGELKEGEAIGFMAIMGCYEEK